MTCIVSTSTQLYHIIHCHNCTYHIMINYSTQHCYMKAPCLTPVREPAPSLAPWDSMLYWFHGFLTCSVDEVVVTNLVLDSTAKVSLTHTTLHCTTLHCATPHCAAPPCTTLHHTALASSAPLTLLFLPCSFNSIQSSHIIFSMYCFSWTTVSPCVTILCLSSRCCCRRSWKKSHGTSARPHLSSAQELSR